MSSRRTIDKLKNNPWVGNLQYPLLPSVLRLNTQMYHLLPAHNGYVGYYNHSYNHASTKATTTRDASTQTDPDPTMEIGKKVIEAYGSDYKIFF